MGRAPTGKTKGNKVRATVTVDPELYAWALAEIEARRFASLSHAIEYALQRVKDDTLPTRGRRENK